MDQVSIHHEFISSSDLRKIRSLLPSLSWEEGRQQTGYFKSSVHGNEQISEIILRCLVYIGASPKSGYDCYLIRYPEGSHIPPHVDDAPFGARHSRLNILVKSADFGGILKVCDEEIEIFDGDAYYFRPDLYEHSVTTIEKGERVILSVGTLNS
jgi:hypothetical protein